MKAQLLSEAASDDATFSEHELGLRNFLEFVKRVPEIRYRPALVAICFWPQLQLPTHLLHMRGLCLDCAVISGERS